MIESPVLSFQPLSWVATQMNRIPTFNLSNWSHTSQDTCLISEKQLSCSHEFVRLLKDWPRWGPRGWPRVHTCPLSRTSRLYEAGGPCCHDKDLRRGMGAWTMAHVISTANVQPAYLSLLFSPSCSLCLSFLKHTPNVLLFEWKTKVPFSLSWLLFNVIYVCFKIFIIHS